LKVRQFSSEEEVIAAAEICLDGKILIFFWGGVGLKKLEQLAKKFIELRREYVD
jgi:hypothetical protein